MRLNFQLALVLFMFFFYTAVTGQKYGESDHVVVVKEWKGMSFSSEESLIDNVSQSPELSRISLILKEFEDEIFLEDFNGTVFVSVDSSYNSMDEKELEDLFSDRIKLRQFFDYYIVPGRLDAYSLKKATERNGGVAKLKTQNGMHLNIKAENEELLLYDSQENKARIIASDFYHKNGFFHLVEGLVFP